MNQGAAAKASAPFFVIVSANPEPPAFPGAFAACKV
jgi:hypothetical protein